MSDRLKELQQQRSIVQQQLDWLDQEIAKAGGQPAPEAVRSANDQLPSPQASPAPRQTTARLPVSADLAAEEIMAQYQQEAHSLQSSVKRGCFLYFFLALGLVALGVIALYFFKTRK